MNQKEILEQRRRDANEVMRQAKDVSMMQRPMDWPRWPLLPVKRHMGKGFPECGFMLEGTGTKVFLMNMFAFAEQKKPFAEIPFKQYASFNDIVADGWTVD